MREKKNNSKEIMAKLFPNLVKTINPWNPETERTPSTGNMKTTPKRFAIKLLKTSDDEKARNADVTQSTVWKVMTADSRQKQHGPLRGSDV